MLTIREIASFEEAKSRESPSRTLALEPIGQIPSHNLHFQGARASGIFEVDCQELTYGESITTPRRCESHAIQH